MLILLFGLPGIVGFLSDHASAVYDLFNNGYYRLRDYWTYLHSRVVTFFGFINPQLIMNLVNYAFQLIDIAASLYGELKTYVFTLAWQVKEIVYVLLPGIRELIFSMLGTIRTLVFTLFNNLYNLARVYFSNILTLVTVYFNNVLNLVAVFFHNIITLVTQIFGQILILTTQIFNQIIGLAFGAYAQIMDISTSLYAVIANFFRSTIYHNLVAISQYVAQIIDFFGNKYHDVLWILSTGKELLVWLYNAMPKLSSLIDGALFAVLWDLLNNPEDFIKLRISKAYKDIRDWLVGEILNIIEEALERYW